MPAAATRTKTKLRSSSKASKLVAKRRVARAAEVDLKALRGAVEDVNKFFKKTLTNGAVALASDAGLGGRVPGFIPTGCYLLDQYLRGGIALGKVTEIFGGPSVGKTTLSMAIAAACQRAGGIVQLVDSESSWTEERAVAMGINLETLIWSRGVRTLEDGFDVIEEQVKRIRSRPTLKDVPYLIIWDTIKKTKTRKMANITNMSERFSGGYGERPQIIGLGIDRLEDALNDHKVALVVVNQVSAKMTPGGGVDSAGGYAFKHALSTRLLLKPGFPKGSIEDKHGPVGVRVIAQLKKNKVNGRMPYDRDIMFPLFFETGVDSAMACAEFLEKKKNCREVVLSGGFLTFKFNGKVLKARRLEVGALVRKHKGMRKWLHALVRKHLLRPAPGAQAIKAA